MVQTNVMLARCSISDFLSLRSASVRLRLRTIRHLITDAYGPSAYFSPTIIQSYGHSAITTQLLNIPPYFGAFVYGMIVATISDRIGQRFLFCLFSACLALTGFAILYVVHDNTHVEYAALFLAAAGTYTAMPMALCWFGMNGKPFF